MYSVFIFENRRMKSVEIDLKSGVSKGKTESGGGSKSVR
jgi:hypothetical protein